jgi:hypothetical protein
MGRRLAEEDQVIGVTKRLPTHETTIHHPVLPDTRYPSPSSLSPILLSFPTHLQLI